MPVNRADYGTVPFPPRFIDVSLDFELEPEGSTVGVVIDEAAVAQFLRCLLLTQQDEWAFEPDNGTRLPSQLFGMLTPSALAAVNEVIKLAIKQRAPMVNLIDVKTEPKDDAGLKVSLYWSMVTTPDQINTTIVNVLTRAGTE